MALLRKFFMMAAVGAFYVGIVSIIPSYALVL